jgi:hypothetical protein
MKTATKGRPESSAPGLSDCQSTRTMRVELKEIPRDFQRSIEQNLRIARAASEKKTTG